jgi:broad-specificity NMP kinase
VVLEGARAAVGVLAVAQVASVVPAVARTAAAGVAVARSVAARSAVVALAVARSAVVALVVARSVVVAVARMPQLAVVLRAGTPALEERLRREGFLQLGAQWEAVARLVAVLRQAQKVWVP